MYIVPVFKNMLPQAEVKTQLFLIQMCHPKIYNIN